MANFDRVATVDSDGNFPQVIREAAAGSEENLTVVADEVTRQLNGQPVYPT